MVVNLLRHVWTHSRATASAAIIGKTTQPFITCHTFLLRWYFAIGLQMRFCVDYLGVTAWDRAMV